MAQNFYNFLVMALVFTVMAPAATHRSDQGLKPKNILHGEGALQGGQSGVITSLLDLRSTVTKSKKLERIVIDIGDATQNKLQGRLGYYTVEMRPDKKLILNFNQTLNSKFSEKELATKLAKSVSISNTKMIFDPLSQTTSLIFGLRKEVAVKVLAVSGAKDTGKLVLDFATISKVAGKSKQLKTATLSPQRKKTQ